MRRIALYIGATLLAALLITGFADKDALRDLTVKSMKFYVS